MRACSLLLTGLPARRCGRRRPHRRCRRRAPSAPTLRGATVYEVSPQDSQLSILVYRGGTLSRSGHNHVMTSQALSGRVWVHREFAQLGLRAFLPGRAISSSMIRRRGSAAGSDFPPDVPQADKDGTRKNMLRAEVLDARALSDVKLQCCEGRRHAGGAAGDGAHHDQGRESRRRGAGEARSRGRDG